MTPTTAEEFISWIDRQTVLLAKEREAEIEETSLLFSNCSPTLLEQHGLALLSLGISQVSIGLGGKRRAAHLDVTVVLLITICSLIELERPTAHHSTPLFPAHQFRPGDIAAIAEHSNASTKSKKAEAKDTSIEGVVYKVSDTKITIAVKQRDDTSEELILPERCKVYVFAAVYTQLWPFFPESVHLPKVSNSQMMLLLTGWRRL